MVFVHAMQRRRRQGRWALVGAVLLSLVLTAPASGSYLQQATLKTNDEVGHSGLGSAVALSADGKTALVGGPQDNQGIGAVWVFVRKGSAWTEQAKLTATGEIGNGRFGTSVALSGDGNTALIGGPADNGGLGAAWVFTRSGTKWMQRGNKLTGRGENPPSETQVREPPQAHEPLGGSLDCVQGQGRFGESVALSSQGKTALIGGPGDSECDGAAWVFARSGESLIQQGEKLTGAEEENFREFHQGEEGTIGREHIGARFGASVALSSDGNTALIGGPRAWPTAFNSAEVEFTIGSAWVLTRSGSTWTQERKENEEPFAGEFGESVALSGDGNTALVGQPGNKGFGEEGAAWVFARSAATTPQFRT
jgi:hypothetical protein